MNTRRNANKRVEKVVVGGNHAPSQDPAAEDQVHVNIVGMTDEEDREALLQIVQAITTKANREAAHRENPQVRTMASRLRDFTTMNTPVYYGSKTNKDPHEFVDEM